MGYRHSKWTKKDRNRFRKVYPYLRRRPSITYCSPKETILEVGSITFTNDVEKSYLFKEPFTENPWVTASPVDVLGNGLADVNIFITELTSDKVTFASSKEFTGELHFQAIWIARD